MTSTSPQTALLMGLSFLKGVGPAALKKVAKIPGFHELSIEQLSLEIPQLSKALADSDAWPRALEAATGQLDEMERYSARALSPLDREYPKLLSATKDDPFLLYVRGTLAVEQEQSIAIIGTREPTSHGQQTAIRISQFCVEQGWSVVSGLALGCDSIAHQATLDAGGHTVAVLAHGLQMIAPASHRKLAESILEAGGALVSQFRFGEKVQRQQYVQRDRVQAGLARGVIMVQSDVKGGSLHASRAALEYGRWLAIPYPTNKDCGNEEPKVQANLLIANGEDSERARLLHCTTAALERVLILHSKADYSTLVNEMNLSNTLVVQNQDSLI
jgi:DNA processing protein